MPPQWAPYHLRLDWQMWFAAMSTIRTNTWLLKFIIKLLEGDSKVLSLLKDNPFHNRPPKYIRARLFRYKFTDRQELRAQNRCWKRDFKRMYLPPQSLDDLSNMRY
ncbi:MAG: lipase maturation factor family protein [Fodinibius sp.]|nr:lipase maturation factor family protein [Fodinibius sp.]